jgi:hypothetical protein
MGVRLNRWGEILAWLWLLFAAVVIGLGLLVGV